MVSHLKTTAGFTLVELLVVVVVISILAAFGINTFSAAQGKARDVQRKNHLADVSKSLVLYYQDKGTYPPGGACVSNQPCWANLFGNPASDYINSMPVDPINSGANVYSYYFDTKDCFMLVAVLENKKDSQAKQTAGNVATSCGGNIAIPAAGYYVTNP